MAESGADPALALLRSLQLLLKWGAMSLQRRRHSGLDAGLGLALLRSLQLLLKWGCRGRRQQAALQRVPVAVHMVQQHQPGAGRDVSLLQRAAHSVLPQFCAQAVW